MFSDLRGGLDVAHGSCFVLCQLSNVLNSANILGELDSDLFFLNRLDFLVSRHFFFFTVLVASYRPALLHVFLFIFVFRERLFECLSFLLAVVVGFIVLLGPLS